MTSPLPDYPWQVIGIDLFELKGVTYLLVVDYFPEIAKLTSTTSLTVINVLKSIFGIPEIIRSDNGPQYALQDFSQFEESYGFQHLISSPHYPQSNGQADRLSRDS